MFGKSPRFATVQSCVERDGEIDAAFQVERDVGRSEEVSERCDLCSGFCDSCLNFVCVSEGIAKPCAKVAEATGESDVAISNRNVHVKIGGVIFGAKGRREVNNFGF